MSRVIFQLRDPKAKGGGFLVTAYIVIFASNPGKEGGGAKFLLTHISNG